MSVKSSATVFRVLRHLAAETRPVTGSDVAHALAVPVTNAVRALTTLEAAGYAERPHRGGGWVIGKSARTLAFAFMAQFPVRDLAMPYLQQLTLETGLTSSLFIRLGWYAVRIAQILGPSVLIHHTRLGEAVPLTAGAPSLAMLAHLPDAAQAQTGGAVEDLGARLAAVLEQGVAVAASGAAGGMQDVAVALRDRQGRVIGAIAVEGASATALPALLAPEGGSRRVMDALAAKIRDESTMELSHYDHVDPERIVF